MKYNELLIHEMLDRTFLVANMFEDIISTHPVAEHPRLKKYITEIEAALFDLYQRVADIDEEVYWGE